MVTSLPLLPRCLFPPDISLGSVGPLWNVSFESRDIASCVHGCIPSTETRAGHGWVLGEHSGKNSRILLQRRVGKTREWGVRGYERTGRGRGRALSFVPWRGQQEWPGTEDRTQGWPGTGRHLLGPGMSPGPSPQPAAAAAAGAETFFLGRLLQKPPPAQHGCPWRLPLV